jgi:hypothetical protein
MIRARFSEAPLSADNTQPSVPGGAGNFFQLNRANTLFRAESAFGCLVRVISAIA